MALTPTMKLGFWAGFLALFIGFIWLFKSILTPFVLGMIIAYLLNPLMVKLSRTKRMPRWVSAALILGAFCVFMIAVAAVVGPMVFRQIQMLITNAPGYLQSLIEFVQPYLSWIQHRVGYNAIEQLGDSLKDDAGKIVEATGGIVGGIAMGGKYFIDVGTTLVLTPIVAFFMMKEWPQIIRWIESLYPRQHVLLIRGLFKQIDEKIAGFIRGQIIVAFILGTLYAVALTVAGLDYGFLIGIGAGLFSIIPLVGSTLGLFTGLVVAWFQSHDPVYTMIIAGIFMTGQFFEGNFLSPRVVGESVGLHPLWVLFALLAGGSLFGIVGMLIAVPVAAVIGVLGGFAIQQYKSSALYQTEPGGEPSGAEGSIDV